MPKRRAFIGVLILRMLGAAVSGTGQRVVPEHWLGSFVKSQSLGSAAHRVGGKEHQLWSLPSGEDPNLSPTPGSGLSGRRGNGSKDI